jgi:hypothetical protein
MTSLDVLTPDEKKGDKHSNQNDADQRSPKTEARRLDKNLEPHLRAIIPWMLHTTAIPGDGTCPWLYDEPQLVMNSPMPLSLHTTEGVWDSWSGASSSTGVPVLKPVREEYCLTAYMKRIEYYSKANTPEGAIALSRANAKKSHATNMCNRVILVNLGLGKGPAVVVYGPLYPEMVSLKTMHPAPVELFGHFAVCMATALFPTENYQGVSLEADKLERHKRKAHHHGQSLAAQWSKVPFLIKIVCEQYPFTTVEDLCRPTFVSYDSAKSVNSLMDEIHNAKQLHNGVVLMTSKNAMRPYWIVYDQASGTIEPHKLHVSTWPRIALVMQKLQPDYQWGFALDVFRSWHEQIQGEHGTLVVVPRESELEAKVQLRDARIAATFETLVHKRTRNVAE